MSRLAAVFSSVASTAVELLDRDLENQLVFRFLTLDGGEKAVSKPRHIESLENRE